MKRAVKAAARAAQQILRWYRTPVGMLTMVGFGASVALAVLGFERVAVALLALTIALVMPYKLRRNEEFSRAADRRAARSMEATSAVYDRATKTEKSVAAQSNTIKGIGQSLARHEAAIEDHGKNNLENERRVESAEKQITAASDIGAAQLDQVQTLLRQIEAELGQTQAELGQTQAELTAKIDAVHELERSHAARVKTIFGETQLIAGLNQTLAPIVPLPHLNAWTLTADAADYFVRKILTDKPKLVVETGSGVSTVLAGLAMARNGSGKIIALEHDKAFFKATTTLLAEHQVEDFATVLYCPLVEQNIAGKSYRWYDIDQLDQCQLIDLLLIDGPPAKTNEHARYPALGELWDMISSSTCIIVDDAGRADEIEVIERWQREHGPISVDRFDHQRGSAVLRVHKPQ